MNIDSISVYVGPNVHALEAVIRLQVDVKPSYAETLRGLGAGVIDRLAAVLPGLALEHAEWGAALHAGAGLSIGDLVARLALALEHAAGIDGTLAWSRSTDDPDIVEVFYSYGNEDIGIEAGEVACDMLAAIARADSDDQEAPDLDKNVEDFLTYADRRSLGPSAMELVRAAQARDIPVYRLNDASLIQIGQGKYQQRIEAALTSKTSHIAVEIASDKNLANNLLADLGLPAPRQKLVYSVDEAVGAAERIGYPVVIKPLDGNHGRGVTVNITSEDGIAEAFETADAEGSAVLVETMLRGDDHRLLVVNGQLAAAARRVPGHVKGDGRHTVAELVNIVNQDPRRGVGHENVLTRLELDDQATRLLEEKGYTAETVPAEGEEVHLRKTANISTGGTAVDVTDTIHPDNKLMAERAIRAIGLDVGAVDFLTTDITKSYRETGGGICEINAGPGLRMHIAPSEGTPRDVGGAIMDMLFPPGTQARVPIAALTGTNGKTTCSRMLAHILKMAGHVVGQTSTDAVLIDGNVTVKGDMTGPVSAKMVLRDPSVDIAVLETARGGIVRSGLGYNFCDVGAVLNVASDHLGLGGVDTLDDLARVKRVVAEVTRGTVVLNADDEQTLKMAAFSPARQVMYVTRNPEHELVREHIRLGKLAVVLEQGVNGDQIVIYDNGTQMPLMWTQLIPATLEGKALHNVENAMFATGMAYALGKTLDQISAGLRTFDNSFFQSPGRMNVFDEHGFRVILDYGHNEAAVGAMVDLVDRLKPRGRRIVGLTCPGDRRDEDATAIAAKVAGHFDTYICHRDDNLRDREPDEVPELLRDALIAEGVAPDAISIIGEEEKALDAALEQAQPDDLVLYFCEAITRCWKQIIHFTPKFTAPEPESVAKRLATSIFDVPDGFALTSDDRGVLIVPAK
ncbi:cyanophycin synthetase [Mycobacterium marinum]|uniref:Cyanophycin synthetase n=1 Tax=Mycobacterium marinum TaxID=1781 RepID=A0A2Z5YED3_MYCMR|nr:cyanophycin synthetase [Mycobacterium marinum]AXN44343.1 Cyanophycin synthetase [Mycobacterium marinum]AXN49713.1 Cyanophycin synthetase [Mycobacterium marinum]RFZ09893.1 Cyanophycin synthetase [Mycobacterium marinum]RFZ17319.1 Cyanophycin synthetase [Mycobacterium marinum]RFZ26493.1 Cyanophycin synthetase [Mycobacterium marinum]